MIRYTLLSMFVAGLVAYAWRDWCKSLCALILMLAVLERPDMPKQMFGIQGMNPFNVALLGIMVAWAGRRAQERDSWALPRWVPVLFTLYILVMALSTARLFLDPSYLLISQGLGLEATSLGSLVADYIVNTFKWVIPAVLLVYGCRGEERQRWLVVGVLGVYAVLALLVMRQMPLMYLLDGEELQQRAATVLQRRVGYHRVDLATMFAGGSWAMVAARPMFSSPYIRAGLLALSGLTALALALTGGRVGYATWCLVGLTLSVLKWRRNLLLLPPAIAMVLLFAPGVSERMLQGLSGGERDTYQVTSGRSNLWPFVLRKIGERPLEGYGRQAWVRTSLRFHVATMTGEVFGHPHNAYFEFALDNGVVGLAVLLPLFGLVLWTAVRMFRSRGDPVRAAIGGMALATTLSYVLAAAGAQTFYPTESSVGMWCLMALAIRVAYAPAAGVVPITLGIKGRALHAPPRAAAAALWPGNVSRGATVGGLVQR